MLRSKYAKKEDIPEGYEDLYTLHADSGEWRLTEVEEVDGYGVNGAVGSLQAERNENRGLKAKLRKFGERDPQTLDAELAELEALRNSKGKASEEVEAQITSIKAQMTEAHQAIIAEKDQREAYLSSALYRATAKTAGMAALTAAKAKAGGKLAWPHLAPFLKVIEPDGGGDPVTKVVDERGNPLLSKDGTRDRTIEEHVNDFMAKDDVYSELFDPEGLGGSGAGAGGGGGGGGAGGGDKPGRRVHSSEASLEDIASGKVIPTDWTLTPRQETSNE